MKFITSLAFRDSCWKRRGKRKSYLREISNQTIEAPSLDQAVRLLLPALAGDPVLDLPLESMIQELAQSGILLGIEELKGCDGKNPDNK